MKNGKSKVKPKTKILFFATHPLLGTGYAKIISTLTNYLADNDSYEIHQFAFQKNKDASISDRKINDKIIIHDARELDPESPLGFGDDAIEPVVEEVEPDIIIIYNDIAVVTATLERVKKALEKIETKNGKRCKVGSYLDLVYKFENPMLLNILNLNLDFVITFANTWKKHLIEDYKYDENKIFVLEHGIDKTITKIETLNAKKLAGLNEDIFLVSNLNRNSYRKNIDLTIGGFLQFIKENKLDKNLKLFLGCHHATRDGYDIFKIVDSECRRLKLNPEEIVNNHLMLSDKAGSHTDHEINIITNMSDCCMNTCNGEGFGLTTLEASSIGKPIICTNLEIFREILGKMGNYCKVMTSIYTGERETHSGILELTNCDEVQKQLQKVYNEYQTGNISKYNKLSKNIVSKYSWDVIFKKLDLIMSNLV